MRVPFVVLGDADVTVEAELSVRRHGWHRLAVRGHPDGVFSTAVTHLAYAACSYRGGDLCKAPGASTSPRISRTQCLLCIPPKALTPVGPGSISQRARPVDMCPQIMFLFPWKRFSVSQKKVGAIDTMRLRCFPKV